MNSQLAFDAAVQIAALDGTSNPVFRRLVAELQRGCESPEPRAGGRVWNSPRSSASAAVNSAAEARPVAEGNSGPTQGSASDRQTCPNGATVARIVLAYTESGEAVRCESVEEAEQLLENTHGRSSRP